jgi:cytochrome c-type biogenesis protein CcmH
MLRRSFVLGSAAASMATIARALVAQPARQSSPGAMMDAGAHRPVRLPPKPGATPSLDEDGIEALEREIHCQCGCGLDVFTCRTTDFSCQFSPAMHRDVLALVNGGYSRTEIVEAFVAVYGEKARMAPKAEGFNIIAYVAPFLAVGGAAVFVSLWIARNLRRQSSASPAPQVQVGTSASREEMERIQRELREDS